MTDDLDPGDSPGLALTAFVVVVCIIGGVLIVTAAALWSVCGR